MESAIEYRWLGRVEFAEALEWQRRLVGERLEGRGGDTVLLLEHEPVYTMGRSPLPGSLPAAPERLPYPVHYTNRGGQSTWHGPGQLVVYPILDLGRWNRDLHAYLRDLEEIVIALCGRHGVGAGRRPGMTGVWVEGERKIASIGVGVRRWISMHGFALNIDADLTPFSAIVPCGISGVRMTSLSLEAGRVIAVKDAAEQVPSEMDAVLLARAGS